MKRTINIISKTLIIAAVMALLLVPVTASAAGGGNGGGGGHGGGGGKHGSSNWHLYGYLTQVPENMGAGEWMIDDEAFLVDDNTILNDENGELEMGAYAHAVGTITEEGQRLAYRVETLEGPRDCQCDGEDVWRLYGEVEVMPEDGMIGQWQIAGEPVMAMENTNFRDRWAPLEVGATVVSAGCFDSDGNRIAAMIGTVVQQAGGGHNGH